MKELFIAGKNDFEEVVGFINGVFSEEFPEFMEKVYSKKNFMRAKHFCIRDGGKLAACAAVYPQDIKCGELTVKCAWIGSVSVASDKRGLGYMKELMAEAEADMVKNGIPFAYLSGKRNRYGFFGYEITGIRNWFDFIESNVRHTVGFDSEKEYEFVPVYESDREALLNIMSLYSKRFIRVRNEEDMVQGMRTWGYRPYAILRKGQFRGYAVIKNFNMPENNVLLQTSLPSDRQLLISELELVSWDELLMICGSLIKRTGSEKIRIEAREWEREKCRLLAENCERYSIETLGNMKIFDYVRTFDFFMKMEAKLRRLKKGRLTFNVFSCCTFFIEIDENGVKTGEADCEEADIFLTPAQLIRLAFTKGGSFAVDSGDELIVNWFPLSYTPERVDEF